MAGLMNRQAKGDAKAVTCRMELPSSTAAARRFHRSRDGGAVMLKPHVISVRDGIKPVESVHPPNCSISFYGARAPRQGSATVEGTIVSQGQAHVAPEHR